MVNEHDVEMMLERIRANPWDPGMVATHSRRTREPGNRTLPLKGERWMLQGPICEEKVADMLVQIGISSPPETRQTLISMLETDRGILDLVEITGMPDRDGGKELLLAASRIVDRSLSALHAQNARTGRETCGADKPFRLLPQKVPA